MQARRSVMTLILVGGLLPFAAVVPVRGADEDGDGVEDALDECCGTPPGVAVDANGRPVGDIDRDCDTDLIDYELFQQGYTGALGPGGDSSCDPVAQTGCSPCEKCTFVPDVKNPADTRTLCRPNGSVPFGYSCTKDPATGLDDCAAGLYCVSNVCEEICSTALDTCPSGFHCAALAGLVDSPGVGTCKVVCDPLSDPSGCSEGKACFILAFDETTICATPDESGTQGVACQSINGCASGYSCILLDSWVDPTGLVCAFICDASQSGGPTCLQGPGPSFTCVQINEFYSDAQGLPDAYGMCLHPAAWDEDDDGVLDFEDWCPGTPPATPVDEHGCPV